MKNKVSKIIVLFFVAFSLGVISLNQIFATDKVDLFSIGDGGSGSGSASIVSGKKNYSSTSSSSVKFEIRSNSEYTSYLLINASVTNGKIKDDVTGETFVASSEGSTSTKVFRKNGTRVVGKFTPYSSRVNGYNLLSYAAYNK